MQRGWQFLFLTLVALGLIISGGDISRAQVTVVNMIPKAQSGETNQDSEPNLAVNPSNASHIAGSAFTPNPFGGDEAPIYVSTDEGNTWRLNFIVPSQAGSLTGTGDITVRFSGTGDFLYAGILRQPGFLRLNILRTPNFLGAATMTVIAHRNSVDQPYVQATNAAGQDRVYVGNNDFAVPGPGRRTATIDQSFNANAVAPAFASVRIEARNTGPANQDGPPIRPALHADGTVYAAFYGWRNRVGNFNPFATVTTDVVVVRDDNAGIGPTPFTDLLDPGDGLAGRLVVKGRTVPWANLPQANFGQERFVGSNITIATDPRDSDTVYIAWADRPQEIVIYQLHVRRSTDRGVTWPDTDLRTINNATNPALAINSNGTVGFLYQQVTGPQSNQRWVTHVELTDDAFTTVQDFVLADVPAGTPPSTFIPYIGDYVHLMSVRTSFYGIFSANNTPDNANFPNGVKYQRNANFLTNTLLDNNNKPVRISIDPFFFKLHPPVTPSRFEYAAKIVCGLQKDPKDMRLARGFYATTINILCVGALSTYRSRIFSEPESILRLKAWSCESRCGNVDVTIRPFHTQKLCVIPVTPTRFCGYLLILSLNFIMWFLKEKRAMCLFF